MLAGATATLTGGADTITGNGGADTINLGSGYADIVKYTATTDGAAAGANTGYDRISNFLSGTDKINFAGAFASSGANQLNDFGGTGLDRNISPASQAIQWWLGLYR